MDPIYPQSVSEGFISTKDNNGKTAYISASIGNYTEDGNGVMRGVVEFINSTGELSFLDNKTGFYAIYPNIKVKYVVT